MIAWLSAFLFTQAVEMPIYALALRHRSWPGRLAIGFGASAITHPLVWLFVLYFARDPSRYTYAATAAELFAVAVETGWIRLFGAKDALAWALGANAASLALGLASRAAFGWP